MDTKKNFIILDVRGKKELDICTPKITLHIPVVYILNVLTELDKKTTIVEGVRLFLVCRYLVRKGYNAVNLRDGIDAWAKEIDSQLT